MNREMSYPFLFLSILFVLVLNMFGSAFIVIAGIIGIVILNNRKGYYENKKSDSVFNSS